MEAELVQIRSGPLTADLTGKTLAVINADGTHARITGADLEQILMPRNYTFPLSVAVTGTTKRVLPPDNARTGLTLYNPSATAKIIVNILGGPCIEGSAGCLTFYPGKGYSWPKDQVPQGELTAATDSTANLLLTVSNTSALDPLIDDILDWLPVTLSEADRTLLGAYTGTLRAAGILDQLDVLAPAMAFTGQSNALVNLASPSIPLTPVAVGGGAAPSFTANRGFVGSGTGIIGTGIVYPSAKYRQDDACMFAFLSNPVTNGTSKYTGGFGGGALNLNTNATSHGVRPNNNSRVAVTLGSALSKWGGFTRRDPTKWTTFRDTARSTLTTASEAMVAREQFIFGTNGAAGAGTTPSTETIGMFASGGFLSNSQAEIFRAATLTLAAAVGAL